MSKNAQTILRCLQEVDRSRPYFVGLLAQRYGWHQEKDNVDADLTRTFVEAEKFSEYLWYEVHYLSVFLQISMFFNFEGYHKVS